MNIFNKEALLLELNPVHKRASFLVHGQKPMATNEVKLLGLWISPFVRRVEWALKLKGVGYEWIEEDIYTKSSRLLGLNPAYKRIPVLVHNGKAIPESLLILEYIDETWKRCPFMPQDPFERAMARFWAKFGDEKIFEPGYNALMSAPGEEKEKAIEMAIEGLEKIEQELEGKQFFGGESIGFLDIALAWISHWLPVWEEVASMKIFDKEKFPNTRAWADRILSHPVIKDSLPPRDKMLRLGSGFKRKSVKKQKKSMDNEDEVKLLGMWSSPFARRVEWSLKLKGVGYEWVEEDVVHTKSSRLLELNPVYQRIPVLVHNRKAIPESLLIMEYIDETWKQCPLMPQDPFERAMARFWAKFGDEKIFEPVYNAVLSPPGEMKEKAIKMAIEGLEKIEEELRGKQFFGGENVGFLDIALACISYWVPVMEEVGSVKIFDKEKFPITRAWADRILSHPVIKENLPPRDKMEVFFQEHLKIMSSKTHGWARVEWSLKMKGVEEDVVHKSSGLLELNPIYRRIPVAMLVHNRKAIPESLLIMEYIDETWKQCPLMPQDPFERAMVRFWAKFGDEKIHDPEYNSIMSPPGEKKEKATNMAIEGLKKTEEELRGKQYFFGGENIWFLDIALAWLSHWLLVMEDVGPVKIFDKEKFPNTSAWADRILSHPVIKNNLPPKTRCLFFYRERLKIMSSKQEDINHNKSAMLLELNPAYQRVPVLVHNGKAIPESLLILEYIDDTWKQCPLMPRDPFEKTMARFWAKFGDEKIFEPAFNALMSPPGEEKGKAIKMANEGLKKIEEELKGEALHGYHTGCLYGKNLHP
ncbi:hypothetical protein Tsubulata_001215 [Turnera subulata]|uniref:glutathione transferase n=1 Tax=Turnera subulata TaxID=218843 RepID=A0A9Q0F6G1_9ROSI|nr:hypothetical protein Tsubulata_001215 [Turnera subulata]